MTTNDTTPVSVRLPADLIEALDAAAREDHRSRNGQVTHLLRQALEQRAGAAQLERSDSRASLTRAAAGHGSSLAPSPA